MASGVQGRGRSARAASHTRSRLNRERILRGALRIVDEHGLQALSMRKLAAELGVEAMSLYNHIEGKDDILDGIARLVFSEIGSLPTDSADWKQYTRDVMHAAREVLSRHRNVVPIIVSSRSPTPAFLDLAEEIVGTFRRAGFDDDLAHHAWHSLVAQVVGYVADRQMPARRSAVEDSEEVASLAAVSVQGFPNLAAIAPYIASCEPVDEFDFGVDVIVAGLEAKLDART